MKVARTVLEDILNELLDKYSLNQNIAQTGQNYYINKNLTPAKIMKILNKENPLPMCHERELYYLCRILAISKRTNNEPILAEDELNLIDTNKYFNLKEIQIADGYKSLPKSRNKSSFTIKNVRRISDKVFIAIMSYDDIIDFMEDGWITYNYSTQRQATVRKKKGQKGIVVEPTINQESLTEIEELIKANKFTPNLITLNITDYSGFGSQDKGFSYANNNITINRGTEVAIIDGFHRVIATIRAKEHAIDPSTIDGVWYVNILNFTIDEAQDYVYREDKRNPIDEKHKATYNKNDASMDVVTKLNSFGGAKTNAMFNRLTTNVMEINYSDKYTTFEVISNAVKHTFDLEKPMNIAFTVDVLHKGFNYIIGLQQDKFDNKNKNKDLATNYNMFAFYVVLICKLKDSQNLMNDLKHFIDKIDFSIDNKFWKNIGLYNLKVNKSVINKMAKYCDGLLQEKAGV